MKCSKIGSKPANFSRLPRHVDRVPVPVYLTGGLPGLSLVGGQDHRCPCGKAGGVQGLESYLEVAQLVDGQGLSAAVLGVGVGSKEDNQVQGIAKMAIDLRDLGIDQGIRHKDQRQGKHIGRLYWHRGLACNLDQGKGI